MGDKAGAKRGVITNRDESRILIVAGPSCVWKTTLIQRLRRGELPTLRRILGVGSLQGWDFKDAWQIPGTSTAGAFRLVLHYDILRPMDDDIRSFDRDPVFDLLGTGAVVTLLTLVESPNVLLLRCRQRRNQTFRYLKKMRLPTFYKRFKRLHRKCRLYKNPPAVTGWYDKWFDFCGTLGPIEHFVAYGSCPENVSNPFSAAVGE